MYSAKIDGERVEFGTSGLLYLSNKLMYDRKTNTLWRQFTGEAVVGPLAGEDRRLELFPVVVTTWGEWLKAHPDTTVLSDDTGIYPPQAYLPESFPDSIYYDYFHSSDLYFPVWQRSDLLEDKEVVLGLWVETMAKAYPLKALREESVVNDELAGTALVVVTDPGAQGARAYLREGHIFQTGAPREGDSWPTVVDENGVEWRVTEEALVSIQDSSRILKRVPGACPSGLGGLPASP